MRMHLFLCFCIAVGFHCPSDQLAAQTAPTSETPWAGYVSPANQDVTIGSDWQPTLDIPADWWPRRSRADWVGVEIGVIGLVREKPTSQLLAAGQTNPVPSPFFSLLDANELQGDMQFGTRGKIELYNMWSVFGGTDIVISGFGINDIEEHRNLFADRVTTIFFNSVPVNPPAASQVIYSTDMYSADMNLRFRTARRIRPITGIRFLKIEDTFDILSPPGSSTGNFSKTNNSLWGGQFGADVTLVRWRNLDFFTSGKFGVMHNRVEGAAELANSSSQRVIKNFKDSEFTGMADGEAGVIFSFVSGLDFKAAYQCIYVDKAASGLDQSNSVSALSPGETVTFDSQFFQGVNLSAQFSF